MKSNTRKVYEFEAISKLENVIGEAQSVLCALKNPRHDMTSAKALDRLRALLLNNEDLLTLLDDIHEEKLGVPVQNRMAGPANMQSPPHNWSKVDEAADASFPASDPPSFIPSKI
jgi:hypothetical protein